MATTSDTFICYLLALYLVLAMLKASQQLTTLIFVIRKFQGINLLLFSLEFRSGVYYFLNKTINTF